jgi:hypothetical protein
MQMHAAGSLSYEESKDIIQWHKDFIKIKTGWELKAIGHAGGAYQSYPVNLRSEKYSSAFFKRVAECSS